MSAGVSVKVAGMLGSHALYSIPPAEFPGFLALLDRAGFDSLELWGADDFAGCLDEFMNDPWERLRLIRGNIENTALRLTVSGQCLLGSGIYADDVTEYFVARAIENGIETIRAYDALNDPRNLETVAASVKKRGGRFEGAMIAAKDPAHSVGFFAGYAALLEKLGADSVGLIDLYGVLTPGDIAELVSAVKKSASVPVSVECRDRECLTAAVGAGADEISCRISSSNAAYVGNLTGEINAGLSSTVLGRLKAYPCNEAETAGADDDACGEMLQRVRADAGYPPLAAPIDRILLEQAEVNLGPAGMYGYMTPGFCALIRGMYGRTPMPPAADVTSALGGNAPMLLARPADMLSPELDTLRAETARYLEQADDILTYAIAGDDAVRFFEYRKAKEYKLDAPNADARFGVHII